MVAADGVLHLDERVPSLLVVVTSGAAESPLRVSELIGAAADAIESNSDLRVRSPEQVGLRVLDFEACDQATRFSCWARIAGERASLEYLFVLSVRAGRAKEGGSAARVSLVLLDLAETRRMSERGGELEDAVFSSAVTGRPATLDVGRVADVRGYFERELPERFQAPLARRDRWGPPGRLRVEG